MIRLADYLMKTLADRHGVRHIFMISGGGNMHLVDALGQNKAIQYICSHHEQACAIGAEAYSRVNRNLCVCLVTTGPGGTNTITGLLGAWLDSIPVLFISGQVKTETLAEPGMRQLGDQETNMIEIVKPLTKYAVMVDNPNDIEYHLEKAITIAKSGRPGPVWIDLPLDIQSATIDESRLRLLSKKETDELMVTGTNSAEIQRQVSQLVQKLRQSKRPVLYVGNGIRFAHAEPILQDVIKKLKVPVLVSFNGMDLVDDDNPFFFGRPGTIGGRASNFILQNSDVLISVGSRLNLRIISYNHKALAREAYKAVVDIDPHELHKKTLQTFDIRIHADARDFLIELDKQLGQKGLPKQSKWLEYCNDIKKTYPVVTKEHRSMKDFASAYYFVERLSDQLDKNAIVAMGDGMACVIPFKTYKVKFGQRLILNSGCAAMGYDLPAAIGSCFANKNRETVCIAGDGSIMLNLQELQTVAYYKLPIKIFVLLNDGYLSIRTTQDTYFGGLHVGSDHASGVSCPNFIKVAQAFGIPTETIQTNDEVETKIKKVMEMKGPVLCTVSLNPTEQMLPKSASEIKPDGTMVSKPLEDLFPFLPRKEFRSHMLIPTLND